MCIPPLLLQPFVENAIWHGLMHKPEGGHIEIRLSVLEGDLLRSLPDGGVQGAIFITQQFILMGTLQ